jgi:hypothetical protein
LQSDEATALEQVRKETGLDVNFKAKLGEGRPYTFYWDGKRIRRENHFLLFKVNDGSSIRLSDENADYHWGDVKDVTRKMSFHSASKIFKHAERVIEELSEQASTQSVAGEKSTS